MSPFFSSVPLAQISLNDDAVGAGDDATLPPSPWKHSPRKKVVIWSMHCSKQRTSPQYCVIPSCIEPKGIPSSWKRLCACSSTREYWSEQKKHAGRLGLRMKLSSANSRTLLQHLKIHSSTDTMSFRYPVCLILCKECLLHALIC